MVKKQKKRNTKRRNFKGLKRNRRKAIKINASTKFDTCDDRISAFGGILAMIKFIDLLNLKEIFENAYVRPSRKPKLGHYNMVIGVLLLLFIGFNRIWHFVYIRLDAMVCGFFGIDILPAATTFWRYVDSCGINQANSLIKVMRILRERAWCQLGIKYEKVHIDIDTTVETIFGNQQGGRKGHNTKYRGKKGYRPILCFIEETREYLVGKLRTGKTMSGEETAEFIKIIQKQLPGCVKEVVLRADGEFLSWDAVEAAMLAGFEFIIANKRCDPPFESEKWYQPDRKKPFYYNSCVYTPFGWKVPCRFIVMRLPKEKASHGKYTQCELFDDDKYTYRIFCTNLKGKAHKIIDKYDKRADVENLVGEAKREGLDAIPSAKFKTNYAFFQIVMLAYNIWRYIKLMAQDYYKPKSGSSPEGFYGIESNTIRIARLKLLYISGKIVSGANTVKVRYSIHDSRTVDLIGFLKYLDRARLKIKSWAETSWPYRFSFSVS